MGWPSVRANRHGVVQLGTSLWLRGIEQLYIIYYILNMVFCVGLKKRMLMYSVRASQFGVFCLFFFEREPLWLGGICVLFSPLKFMPS